jgi:hypothetical protein
MILGRNGAEKDAERLPGTCGQTDTARMKKQAPGHLVSCN